MLTVVFGIIATTAIWCLGHYLVNRGNLPPGPTPLPFLGNVLQLDRIAPWETYVKWARVYGDFIRLNILGRDILVVNSRSLATELVDKRSTVYSDRPDLVMIRLMGWNFHLAFLRYHDPRRRKIRRLIQTALGPISASRIQELLIVESHHLLIRLVNRSEEFGDHLLRFVADTGLEHILGLSDKAEYNNITNYTATTIQTLSLSVFFDAQAVFAIPALRYLPAWFPGAGFKRCSPEQLRLTSRLRDEPYSLVKKQLPTGDHLPSWLADVIEGSTIDNPSGPSEDDVKDATATMIAGSGHTTSSVLQTLVLALVLNPEVQRRAQAEIDGVVGSHRLPTFEDQSSLPYTSAICRESLRWHCPLPLTGHAVSEDDEFRGYTIPTETTVMMNIWAMTRDPTRFCDADKFIPERFITEDGALSQEDETSFVWGFGRRSCPGKVFAESALWITAARLLAVFNIKKLKDLNGNEISVEERYINEGLFVYGGAHFLPNYLLTIPAEPLCLFSAILNTDQKKVCVCWSSASSLIRFQRQKILSGLNRVTVVIEAMLTAVGWRVWFQLNRLRRMTGLLLFWTI